MFSKQNSQKSIIIVLALCFGMMSVFATTQGPNTADVVNDPGNDWSPQDDARISDDQRAETNLVSGETSGEIWVTDYDFSLPTNAIIDGINVSIERTRDSGGTGGAVRDASVRLINRTGGVIGSNRATNTDWVIGDTTEVHGNSTDLWGTTWTATDINDVDFGVAISVQRTGGTGTRIASIDSVRITITYHNNTVSDTTAPATVTSLISSAKTNQSITWTWTNPANADFNSTIITLNGVNVVNLSSPTATYTANNLVNNTLYTLGVRTKDHTGNINTTTSSNVTRTSQNADGVAPILDVPSNIINEATSASGKIVSYSASATDNSDPSPTVICTTPSDSTFPLGTTSVSCTATDVSGNSAVVSFNVTIQDTTAPVFDAYSDITGVEATSASGASVSYDLPTATDSVDSDVDVNCVPSSGSTFAIGTTSVDCTATDDYSNSDSSSFSITVVDTTAPSITLNGDSEITIEVGTDYTDDGATASDIVDGDITESIITNNAVDSETVGTYSVTYDVTDSNGNAAEEVTRTVHVVDTTIPVITIQGANPIDVHFGDTYEDAGAIAEDNYDGDITESILTSNSVDTGILGSQTVTYDVTDSNGNSASQATRTVNVIDVTIPIITMNGESPITIAQGSVYSDDGATAQDDADGDITESIITNSNVNTDNVGEYTVTYDVTDSSGNAASTVTRNVIVTDQTAPVITLNDDSEITIEVGTEYEDAGASATDNVDEEVDVSVNDTVNASLIGDYIVTYNAEDKAGNVAEQVTRTVHVVDTTSPQLTSAVTQDLNGDGFIDAIELTFDENIDDSMLESGTADGWDVSGYDGESVGTGNTANDNVLLLTFTQGTTQDTGATPVISYSQSEECGQECTSTHDLSGNELENLESGTEDGANPIITLLGDNPANIQLGSEYSEAGWTVSEEVEVIVNGTVDTSIAGAYPIIYSAIDEAGNGGLTVRTVNVLAPETPVPSSSGGRGGGGARGTILFTVPSTSGSASETTGTTSGSATNTATGVTTGTNPVNPTEASPITGLATTQGEAKQLPDWVKNYWWVILAVLAALGAIYFFIFK